MSTTNLDTCNQTVGEARGTSWRRPSYDVTENGDAYKVLVSVPGVNKAGVEVRYEDDVLSIVASRASVVPEGWRPLRREVPLGDYRLNLQLNVDVEAERISAKVQDGVLELLLPKAEASKPRKIAVK